MQFDRAMETITQATDINSTHIVIKGLSYNLHNEFHEIDFSRNEVNLQSIYFEEAGLGREMIAITSENSMVPLSKFTMSTSTIAYTKTDEAPALTYSLPSFVLTSSGINYGLRTSRLPAYLAHL